MKVKVEIRGCIDIPDIWADPKHPSGPLGIADYHYNDKLDVEDAINDLAKLLKEYPDDLHVDFMEG